MNSAYQSFRATQATQRKRERDEKARRRDLEAAAPELSPKCRVKMCSMPPPQTMEQARLAQLVAPSSALP